MHLVKMHYVSSELKVGKAEIQTKRKQPQKKSGVVPPENRPKGDFTAVLLSPALMEAYSALNTLVPVREHPHSSTNVH